MSWKLFKFFNGINFIINWKKKRNITHIEWKYALFDLRIAISYQFSRGELILLSEKKNIRFYFLLSTNTRLIPKIYSWYRTNHNWIFLLLKVSIPRVEPTNAPVAVMFITAPVHSPLFKFVTPRIFFPRNHALSFLIFSLYFKVSSKLANVNITTKAIYFYRVANNF